MHVMLVGFIYTVLNVLAEASSPLLFNQFEIILSENGVVILACLAHRNGFVAHKTVEHTLLHCVISLRLCFR